MATSEIDGTTYLFLEHAQQLCAISESSSRFLQRCAHGVIADSGLTPEEQDTARALVEFGAIDVLAHAGDDASVAVAQSICLAGVQIVVCFESESCLSIAMEPFAALAAPAERADAYVIVAERGGEVGIGVSDAALVWVDRAQCVPVLKMAITEAFMMSMDGLLLHAATTIVGSKAMLLMGDPGAGKSTLALAAAGQGHMLAGDDLVLLEADGRARALGLPATLKPGSWSLLQDTYPAVSTLETYRRLDGQDARYIPLDTHGSDKSYEIGWIVLLDRQDNAKASFIEVAAEEIFANVLRSTWTGEDELEAKQFRAIASCMESARCVRLTYSDLDSAVRLLDAMCSETLDLADQPALRRGQ